MTNSLRGGTNPVLSSAETAELNNISGQAVRANCSESRYPSAHKDPSGAWRIPLSSLPPVAQARYWAKHANIAPGGWKPEERRELPKEEAEALWEFFEKATPKLRDRAYLDAGACHVWQTMKAQGRHYQEALDEIKREYGLGKSALYDKIGRIKGYDPQHWPALLVGQWAGENVRRAEWHPEAYKFFISNALTPGCKIKTAYDRTQRLAAKNGWGELPSYGTAKNDFKRLDQDVVTFIKEGETALKVKSPTAVRDYDFPLHTIWSLDGRRQDVMVIDRKGKYGQAGRVFRLHLLAIQEVRSRMLLGYALGGALDADLVRGAFLAALKTTGRLIPRKIQLDNGMENAAKEITGGAPWRRRGKVMEDEIIGLFPMLNIDVEWTTTAHGQAKPVERLFGTLAQMVETRPELRGAYCGHSPEARPEEWDASKAVPVEVLEKLLDEEIAAYHRTPHRGNGMGGKSPMQVYTDQINRKDYPMRRITEAQQRLCAYSAAPIVIRRDASFTILSAAYWSEGTAKLAPGKGYYARYNPDNLSDTVYVYRKEKRLCEASRKELTPFNDKAAAKDIMKKRAAYTKSTKQRAAALEALSAAESKEYLATLGAAVAADAVDKETGEILPKAEVLEMVRSNAENLPERRAQEEAEEFRQLVAEMEETLAAERKKKRAFGGV